MKEVIIIVNPTDKIIDEDLEKAELIIRVHDCKSHKQIGLEVKDIEDKNKYKVVYVHYYTKDKTYILGVVECF